MAIKELKNFELKTIIKKIRYLEGKVIPELEKKLANNLLKIKAGENINLGKHRNLRRSIVAKKSKLNKLK